MSSILLIGECMMELVQSGVDTFKKNFAGDTFNTAVYAKRCSPGSKVSYLSAVGSDSISDDLVGAIAAEAIDTSLIYRDQKALPGIYLVSTDDQGERTFLYWRENSAARQVVAHVIDNNDVERLKDFDTVYFSGISLAILSETDKQRLFEILTELKASGAKICFDPNYRPRLWDSQAHASAWISKAYQLSDLVFASLEEHEELFDQNNQSAIHSYLNSLDVKEQVIKCGDQGSYVYCGESVVHLPLNKVKQVDTTAAGDSFSGSYLAAREEGKSTQESLDIAAAVSALVVQCRGAIVDERVFAENFSF